MSRLLQAALLGILQGLTEFLPVSSTAHLLVGGRLLGFADPGGVFTVIIQFGSILAVVWIYRIKVVRLVVGLFDGGDERRFALAILAAFVPALVAGALLADFVKQVLYESFTTIAVALVLGGVVMLLVERRQRVVTVREASETPVPRALVVGLCQTLALIPGVSRSGGTIIGGMLAGLDRRAAAEFSFFLAMPTMAAAFVHDVWEVRHELSGEMAAEIGVGLIMAFLAALAVVTAFLNFVGRSGFAPFAWYRIVLGGALLAALASGTL
ncbi:MAG: undecaprenyl-diphosphate phosphatase [Vicinamibacterales bacterium]